MISSLGRAIEGDCLARLGELSSGVADLVYLDPPFFTNRKHSSITRDRKVEFSFDDLWSGLSEYASFLRPRLEEARRVLKDTGSIFVHCDSSANFLIRALLDQVFGENQFRSEIIWHYKRWSNSSRNLLPCHQTILFYSKSSSYKFNQAFGPYSESTNVDQILQLRQRDEDGVSQYARDSENNPVLATTKKGVPLSDVWDIPFLNPKAKERTGYPTQKPILLLEQIVELVTDRGDLVVDPFCGSGTTLVAASILGRESLGIDISPEAVALSNRRLSEPVKTHSELLKRGREAYATANMEALGLLVGLTLVPVHRNSGIDAFISLESPSELVPVRVQRPGEELEETATLLTKAARSKRSVNAVLIRTNADSCIRSGKIPEFIQVVDATAIAVQSALENARFSLRRRTAN